MYRSEYKFIFYSFYIICELAASQFTNNPVPLIFISSGPDFDEIFDSKIGSQNIIFLVIFGHSNSISSGSAAPTCGPG